MADKIHCVKKTLRLTPAESRLLSEKAEAFHMNEAEYLRLLISQTPNDYPEIRQGLKQLINEVNHIGVNINQIVHHHNYELYSKEDRQQLIAYMKNSTIQLKRWWCGLAISKILHMKDCGRSFHGKHLKYALEYITVPEKTQNGRLVSAINCQVDNAFEQMKETKKKFNKTDKRQAYHIILSFKEGEVSPDTVFELTERFVKEYLGNDYEAVFAVHDNTEHPHSHIVFNSVSFRDGKKYHYQKEDWEKYIQPITNRLCKEYGLSTIELDEESGKRRGRDSYQEWNSYRDGKFVWSRMVARDVDACIIQAASFESFVSMLENKGYEVKMLMARESIWQSSHRE